MTSRRLRGVCSMAVEGLLREVTDHTIFDIGWVALGGVDVERRIASDAPAELVVLAEEAIERLAKVGAVAPSTIRPLVRSATAIAVPLDVDPGPLDERALRALVQRSGRIARSTGPSGRGVATLLDRWGLEAIEVIVAPPGLPVADLIADGLAPIGFQQRSELAGHPVRVLPMPVSCAIVTTFAAAAVRHPDVAYAATVIDTLIEAATPAICARHEMQPISTRRQREHA